MKTKSLIIVLSALFLSLTAFAQPKKVAVYVTGEEAGINKVLGSKLSYAIGRNDNYSVIERADGFLAAMAKEQSYQRTGAVDDDEISRIGKQFGAQLVCVTTIDKAFDIPYISARLIDVETAEIEGAANVSSTLTSSKDVMSVGDTLTERLLKSMSSSKVLAWKKVAVYLTQSEAGKNIAHILGNQLVEGFSNTGRYVAVERTSTFLSRLGAEQNYQRTGAVDDKEISRIGKQMGVQYVCVVDITDVLGENYISARMIDVETAEIINMYETAGNMDNIESCANVANQITQRLSKGTYEEQLYEDARYEGVFLYKEGKNNLPQVNIPDWFMNLEGKAYVGISMPGGDALDAIGMALIQKILANNEYIWYDSKLEGGTSEDKMKKESYFSGEDSIKLSVGIEMSYNIQELAKLPSDEYICRITDGHRNKLRMEITFDEQMSYMSIKSKNEENESGYHTVNLNLEYNKRNYEMNIMESVSGFKDKSSDNKTIQYICSYKKEFDQHNYIFRNECKDIFDNLSNAEESVKMLYIFPSAQVSDNPELNSYTNYYNPKKSLAEQLLVFYMDIIRKELPYNNSGYIVRKKTPIVSMQYNDETFIINTTKEE